MVDHVSDSNFQEEVLQSPLPVLVDFWAEWCGPCQMLGPILDDVAPLVAGKVRIAKMNIDQNTAIPASYGVRSIPTMILFKDGQALSTKVGLMTKTKIVEWLESI
jgi:thioredoxin 1